MTTETCLNTIRDTLGPEIASAAERVHSIAYYVTDADIACLRSGAAAAGDDDCVALCDAALAGDGDARDEVKGSILDARCDEHGWGSDEVRDAVAALAELAEAIQSEEGNDNDDLTDHLEVYRRDAARSAAARWCGVWRGACINGSDEVADLAGVVEDACKRKTF